MEIIAVNSGNYSTKAKSREEEIIFRTKVQENQDATKYVLFDGKRYEVGEGSIDIDNLKHDSLTHKLCTLYAISMLHKEQDVFLVTCLPVNQFKRKDLREAYKQSLIGTWEVTTEKGKDIFIIKDVLVYMEGAAPLLAYQDAFKNTIVSVVDIGGFNVNVSQYDKLHLVVGTEDDFDFGVYNIKSKIMHDLNKEFNIHLKEHELNYVIQHPNDRQLKIITKHHVAFINQLKNELKQRGYNLSLNQLFFTGGGSVDLEISLISAFANCSVGNVFDTVRGLYQLGVMKCDFV